MVKWYEEMIEVAKMITSWIGNKPEYAGTHPRNPLVK